MKRRLVFPLALGMLFAGTASGATAQDVEAELHLFGQSAGHQAGPAGLGGLIGVPSGGTVLPGFRIGVRLSDRLVIATGMSGGWSLFEGPGSEEGVQVWSIQIPVEVKLYLAMPAVGDVAPLFRLVGTWSYSDFGGWTSERGLGAAGLLGAQYLATERFGILLEGGVDWSTHALRGGGDQRRTQLGVTWRTGLVLRI